MKTNLSYFQHSTTLFLDVQVRRLIKKYESNGFLVFMFIRTEIFRINGYYLEYNDLLLEDITLWFSFIEKREGIEIINFLIDIDLFNKGVFVKHRILTSRSIQKDFLEIMTRMKRKGKLIDPKINLIDDSYGFDCSENDLEDIRKVSEEFRKSSETFENSSPSTDKSSENFNNNGVSEVQSSELSRKVEQKSLERKLKERKENEISLSINRERLSEIFLIEKNYPIEELDKFLNHYAKTGWIDKNGNKIIDILATARNWKQIDTPPKFYISTAHHENWKKVWGLYESLLGFEKAIHLLNVKPIVNSKTIIFKCSEEDKDLCEVNIDCLKKALRSVFGNAIKLEYQF